MYRSFVSRDGEISFSVMFRTSLKLATFVQKKGAKGRAFGASMMKMDLKKREKLSTFIITKKEITVKLKISTLCDHKMSEKSLCEISSESIS